MPNFTPELYIETTLYEHMVTSHVSEKNIAIAKLYECCFVLV